MSKFSSESLLDFLRCKLCCGSIACAEGRNKGSVHACKTVVARCKQPDGVDAPKFVQAKLDSATQRHVLREVDKRRISQRQVVRNATIN